MVQNKETYVENLAKMIHYTNKMRTKVAFCTERIQ